MTVRRVVPNLPSRNVEESRAFYTGLFGFRVAMDMGFLVTLASPSNPTAQVSLAKADGKGPSAPTLTIEVEDVVAVHAEAVRCGATITHPLTLETFGVKRFGVSDPDGVVLNVMSHRPGRGTS